MPDEYDAIRRNLSNYEKGLYFEIGRAYICGETRDKGWVQQFAIRIGRDVRILDSARTMGKAVEAVERKSGRVNEKDALRQLRIEKLGIDSGKIARSTWETVAGEKVPEKVLETMGLLADTGKYDHRVISRKDAVRAVQIGRALVSQQLELMPVYELQRAERARQRLAKIREIVKQREQAKEREAQQKSVELAQARAERFRKMAQFRDAAARGRADAPERIQQAREPVRPLENERARIEREAAERVVREFQGLLFPVSGQTRDRESVDLGRDERARLEQQSREHETREQAREQQARDQARDQQARQAERTAALDQLRQQGLSQEVVNILALGQAQPPSAAVERGPGGAPEVTRGGRESMERSRELRRER